MNNEEIVVGIVNEFRYNSYFKNEYSHWLALITNSKKIIFLQAYFQKQLYSEDGKNGPQVEYEKIDELSQLLQGCRIEKVLELPNKKILISKENKDNVKFRFKGIAIKNDHKIIKLKTYRKQLKIVEGVLKNNLSYEESLRKSGLDYSRIIYWALIIFIFLTFFLPLVYYNFVKK